MKILLILIPLFSLLSFAQPFSRQSQWEKYFENNIQKLDPIEGIWSISTILSLYIKNDLKKEDTITNDEMVAIYNVHNEYKIYSQDKYNNFSKGTFHNTAVRGVYLFKIFYNASHTTVKTNAILIDDGLLEFSYYAPDSETEIVVGDSYITGMKFKFDHKWVKIAPQTKKYTEFKPKSGTGFGISSDGIIVTNYHIIDGANSIYVRGINFDFTKTYKAKVLISDKSNDLSLIQIEDDEFKFLDTIPYVIKTNLAGVGENIFVLGYPLRATMGDEIKLTNGIISSRTGFQGDVTSYQISAPVQPGSSGGPLFDNQGNLIGIVSAKHLDAENVSYAIKALYLTSLLELLPNHINMPTLNSLEGRSLANQVELIKKFIYIIEAE